jgi:hypothetical protein
MYPCMLACKYVGMYVCMNVGMYHLQALLVRCYCFRQLADALEQNTNVVVSFSIRRTS